MGLKSASKYKKEEGALGGGVGEHIIISKVKKGGVAWRRGVWEHINTII